MKRTLFFSMVFIITLIMSSCNKLETTELNTSALEIYEFVEVTVDNNTTIDEYKADKIVAAYWIADEDTPISKRLFIFSGDYIDFLIVITSVISEYREDIRSSFSDLDGIEVITVRYDENVLYLGPSSIDNATKNNSFSINFDSPTMEYYISDQPDLIDKYFQAFSGINLADILLPYLLSDDDLPFSLLLSSLASMGGFNLENGFTYIDIYDGVFDHLSIGGSDFTVEQQGNIGIYVDDNGVLKVIESKNPTFLAVKYNEDDV